MSSSVACGLQTGLPGGRCPFYWSVRILSSSLPFECVDERNKIVSTALERLQLSMDPPQDLKSRNTFFSALRSEVSRGDVSTDVD